MKDPEPFRWAAQSAGAKTGIVLVGALLGALVMVVLVILAGFAWDAVLWAWS